MKIGIISDTHDNLPKIREAVAVFLAEGVEHVIHAGDFIAPFTATPFLDLMVSFTGVFGNNDGERRGLTNRFAPIGEISCPTAQLELSGRRIVVMHEPDLADAVAASGLYDVIIYGHTHQIDIRKELALIVNPGEACGWVTGRCTVVVLDMETMEPKLIDL